MIKINRTTRLRWRRRFRSSRKQVEGMGTQAEEQLERHFFKRLGRLEGVRRFLITWILLVLVLIGGLVVQIRKLGDYYLSLHPVAGGTYVEGMLGSFTNANPLYATTNVDSSVSKLIFSGLFKYDQNHQLVGDLATSWEVSDHGTDYTVHLGHGVLWQDGYSLTASDVVFTYQTLQNPDVKSPFAASWQGITVTAKDPFTVDFKLPNVLSSFPYSMTNGIVPKHLLAGIPPTQLRSISFNTDNPIGSGPFSWSAVQVSGYTPETHEQEIALVANSSYYAGKPKLSKFVIRSFYDEKRMQASFKRQELTAMAGLQTTPKDLLGDAKTHEYSIPLLGEVMVFLKTSSLVLQDVKVRQALTMGTDEAAVASGLGYPVIPAKGPLLASQLGYDKTSVEAGYDPAAAKATLDAAGWKVGPEGVRYKDGKPLTFSLYSQNTAEYHRVVELLQKQWQAIGVAPQIYLESEADLHGTLSTHNYDALLYGISIGVDPDVYAYWDSSQADVRVQNRLNFSEYRSTVADNALEAGRTRINPAIRAVKYKPFLDAWRIDAPAIALYQPRFLYLSRGQVFNFDPHSMTTDTDRYANVENWMILEDRLQK
jgi:peptide/nickel transport system substrate-binding protein